MSPIIRNSRFEIQGYRFSFRNSRFAILETASQEECWTQQRHFRNLVLGQKRVSKRGYRKQLSGMYQQDKLKKPYKPDQPKKPDRHPQRS